MNAIITTDLTPPQPAPGGVSRAVQIGSSLHVWIGADQAELDAFAPVIQKTIDKALHAGKGVLERGTLQWIDENPVFDPSKGGSTESYIWHADGNRVRTERVLFTKSADGTLTKKSLGLVWRKW